MISFERVKTEVPLEVAGHFNVHANDIEIKKPLHVDGKGRFRSAGKLTFDRTHVRFEGGIDAEVDEFISAVSRIESLGRSRLLSRNMILQSEKSETGTHRPSIFRQQGDLYLEAREKALNDASHFLVEGSLFLAGKKFENRNRTHTETVRKKVGTRAKKILGVKVGKSSIYEEHKELKIDGVANTQVSNIFHIQLSGTLSNDGVIETGKFQGEVGDLRNGIFSDAGKAPETYTQSITSLHGSTNLRPGGELRSTQGMHLKVHHRLENRGFIETHGADSTIEAGVLENRKPLSQGIEDVIKEKTFGRHSKRTVEVDHPNPGGEIRGAALHFKVGQGLNQGGIVSGVTDVQVIGEEWINQPLSMRSVVHLSASNSSPWTTKKGYSIRTDFHGALVSAGEHLSMRLQKRVLNEASDLISWGSLSVQAGELVQKTAFSSYLSQSKQDLARKKHKYTVVMREGSMQSMQGDMQLTSTKGNIYIEGKVGSYLGDLSIQ